MREQATLYGGGEATTKLLEKVREVIRIKHYSLRTEQAYLRWIRQYIPPPQAASFGIGPKEARAFLSHLPSHGSASNARWHVREIVFNGLKK